VLRFVLGLLAIFCLAGCEKQSGEVRLLMFDADGNPRRDLDYYGDLLVDHCWVVIDDYFGPGRKTVPIRAQVDEMVSEGRLVPFGYYGWSTWIGQWQS
jgi:hypothetical protein